MANALSPYFPEFWAKTAQVLHKPRAIYRQIANFRGESVLKNGDVFHRILPNTTQIQDYTRYSDIDGQDINGTDETLTVDSEKAFRFSVDDFDEIQSNLSLAQTYAKNAMTDLTNVLDSDLLYEAVNATSTVDDETIGGSSDTPITLAGSNVFETFTKVQQKLGEQNVDLNSLYGVIDPATAQIISSQVGGRETSFGDTVTRNGFMGNMLRYNGMDLFVTNNYTSSIELSIATQPTNGDTVVFTIAGEAVTFTFVTSIGTTAGNVLIGASADTARANLETLINAPGTTTAQGVALTGTDLYLLQQSVAVDTAADDTLDFYAKGKTVVGTETLTDATDGFVAAKASRHLQFGRKGAVDMVVQDKPNMAVRLEPKHFAGNVMGRSLYGIKTYTDGAAQLVDVRVLLS
jgi:hypothetical protein